MGVLTRDVGRVFLLVLLGLATAAAADPALEGAHSEDEIKSAMLYNFAKFVEWPAGTLGDAPLVIGVIGDDSMVSVLKTMLRTRAVHGHPVAVRRLSSKDDPRSLLILYVGACDRNQTARILQAAGRAPVLTIGDSPQFSRQGGVIAFIRDGDRIRFEINLDAAGRAGLQISSKLLQLASIWREGGEAGN